MNLADPTQSDPAAGPAPDEPPSTTGGPPPGSSHTIDLSLHTDDADPPLAGWLDVMLARAADAAGVVSGRVGLVLVADDEMAQLHETWKNVPGTTDVLTFDLSDEDALADTVEGDIVVCIDEARRQAKTRSHTLRHEALLYAVHGLLHLLGEDDQDPESFAQMHRREDEILTHLGVGPVFERGDDPT